MGGDVMPSGNLCFADLLVRELFSAFPPSSDRRTSGFGHFRCVSNPLGMGVNVLIPSSFLQQKKAVCVNTHASPIADISDSELRGGCSTKQVRPAARHRGPTSTAPTWGRGCGRASGRGVRPECACAAPGRGRGRGYKRAEWAKSFCSFLPRAAVFSTGNRLGCALALCGSCLFSGSLHDALLLRAGRCWPLLLEVRGRVGFHGFPPPFPRLRCPAGRLGVPGLGPRLLGSCPSLGLRLGPESASPALFPGMALCFPMALPMPSSAWLGVLALPSQSTLCITALGVLYV